MGGRHIITPLGQTKTNNQNQTKEQKVHYHHQQQQQNKSKTKQNNKSLAVFFINFAPGKLTPVKWKAIYSRLSPQHKLNLILQTKRKERKTAVITTNYTQS